MKTNLIWLKHNALEIFIFLIISIVMVISINVHKKPTIAKTNSAFARIKPPFNFQTYTNKVIKNESVFVAIINPSFDNAKYMPNLCNYLNKVAILNPKQVYSASVFDDSTAPALSKTLVEIEEGTEAQQDDYANHFIIQYTYNPITKYNTCTIFYNGLGDPKQQNISY